MSHTPILLAFERIHRISGRVDAVIVSPVTVWRRSGGRRRNCGLAHRPDYDRRVVSIAMTAKYYTQFRLTDADYRGGNEFSGVVELSQPMDENSDISDIVAILAKNFDLQQSAVQLVSWSRLH